MARLRYVDLSGTIGSGNLTNVATSHTFTAPLTYAAGVTVPTLAGSDYFLLTILNTAGSAVSEVVKVTAYNSGTGAATIARAQEGTSGVAHTSGDKVMLAVYTSDLPIMNDAIYVPLTGQTSIDEFNDGTVDSAWLDCDPATAPSSARTWTEAGDAMSVYHTGGDSANSIRGKVRLLSGVGGAMTTGDAILARITQFPIENGQLTGLVLSTAGTVAGVQLAALAYNGTTQMNHALWDFTAWASGAGHVNQTLGTLMPMTYWSRFVYLGSNSWRHDMSGDGLSWINGATPYTWANTPTHVGLASGSWGTKKSTCAWDNLRRVAGVT